MNKDGSLTTHINAIATVNYSTHNKSFQKKKPLFSPDIPHAKIHVCHPPLPMAIER